MRSVKQRLLLNGPGRGRLLAMGIAEVARRPLETLIVLWMANRREGKCNS